MLGTGIFCSTQSLQFSSCTEGPWISHYGKQILYVDVPCIVTATVVVAYPLAMLAAGKTHIKRSRRRKRLEVCIQRTHSRVLAYAPYQSIPWEEEAGAIATCCTTTKSKSSCPHSIALARFYKRRWRAYITVRHFTQKLSTLLYGTEVHHECTQCLVLVPAAQANMKSPLALVAPVLTDPVRILEYKALVASRRV